VKPGNPYPRDIVAPAPAITPHRPTVGELAREHFKDFFIIQVVLRNLYAPIDWNDINEVEVLTNGSRKQLKRSQLMRRRLMKILKEHAAKEWWNGNADDIKEGELHWHILLQIMCSEEHREWREIGTPRTQNEIDDINYVIRLVNGMWVMLANSDYAMKTGRLKTIQEMVWALLAYGISIAQNQLL
jgi:hypothetical protein